MRRILLDSCVWLWWLDDNPALGKEAKALINDERNLLFISAATVWEIAIKRQKGGLQIDGDLQALVLADGFIPLAIDLFHAQICHILNLFSLSKEVVQLYLKHLVEPVFALQQIQKVEFYC